MIASTLMQANDEQLPVTLPTQPALTTWQRLALVSGLLVGFALRLFQLGGESLWYDETVSVVLARKSIPDLLAHTAGDIHPPGYYLLLHWWQAWVSPTLTHGLEFLFAWPSLVCGVLMIALLFALGRRLLEPTTAVIGIWLAALNPFHIWYSQEVRMYTLGALLGLLALWAVIKWRATAQAGWRWLALYAVAGASGLYTLYYFLFVLVALNLIVLLELGFPLRRAPFRINRWLQWGLAQVAILLLWSPWVGIFWRQATDPPVPPWRVAWESGAAVLAAVSEGVSALLMGQSAPNPTSALWLLVVTILLLFALHGYANQSRLRASLLRLWLYLLVPTALLYLLTYFSTPLYHVRYLFTYAPPLLLLVAAGLTAVGRRQPWLAVVIGGALLAINGMSLQRFWFDPLYRSDDHRAAVAQLAKEWRPGDLILVNAGWVYPVLETYWPTTLSAVTAALPPPLPPPARLLDYAQFPLSPTTPLLVRGGSIDGPASLGWGDPASDFFAIDSLTTAEALLALSRQYARLWHYRLYDTVSDPKGQIRTWLAANGEELLNQAIPGRDYLALQLYRSNHSPPSTPAPQPLAIATGRFGAQLELSAAQLLTTAVAAGQTLYLHSEWQRLTAELPATVSFSLRLYSPDGFLFAQQDETPRQPAAAWSTTASTFFGLALPIPVATPPGSYDLRLVVYDGNSGTPLQLATGETELELGEVTVTKATVIPTITTRLARFDYIDLVQATVPALVTKGGALNVTLFWLPHPNPYRDTYVARLTLRDAQGTPVQQWEDALGGWRYPSGGWPAGVPVRHDQRLTVAPTTAPGLYTLTLQVQRQSDGVGLAAATGWWQSTTEVALGQVELTAQ